MPALVVAAHGSHRNAHSHDPAYAHADAIRATGDFTEVRAAFWKEEPAFREVLRTLASTEVYVVPLFVSEGYFTETVLPRELRLADWDAERWGSARHRTLTATDTGQTVHYCRPVGTHPAMTDVIVRRAETVTGREDVGPGVGLGVVGHGTERNANSAKAVRDHADRIAGRERFDAVAPLFMDERPAVAAWRDHLETPEVVLVPLFVADGYHTQEDIPEDAGLTDDASDGYPTPARVHDRRVWYAGAVGTEPLVADVIRERAADAGAPVEREVAVA